VRRRDFIAALMLGATAAADGTLQIWAQSPAPRRIAFVHSGIPAAQLTEASDTFWVRRFFVELRGLGYAEPNTLVVDRYSAEGHRDRFAPLAKEIVARRPDLIVANQNPLVTALKEATAAIPIVAIVGDPVGSGLVASLAHPGGNVTGVSVDAGIEIYGKRLQILKEAVPPIRTVAYLGLSGDWQGQIGLAMREAAQGLGISMTSIAPAEVTAASLRAVFAGTERNVLDALVVSGAGDFLAHRQLIVDLTREQRLTALYPYRDYVDVGGLMTYAPELGDLARHLAHTARQVLQGANASDIPVYQAAKFELVINLKTATALGLTVPQSLLQRADEIIE